MQSKIIKFCQTPRSVAEIAEMIGVKDKKWVKDKYMKPSLARNLHSLSPIDQIAAIKSIRLLRELFKTSSSKSMLTQFQTIMYVEIVLTLD
ncbi:MAG: hypothetical protein Q4C05_01850 [Akkermansia sp.]|nr:hypothetical protein [Akkermansia sp.]